MEVNKEQRESILELVFPLCEMIEDESYAYELTQLIINIIEEDGK